jgi:hypothetical protein
MAQHSFVLTRRVGRAPELTERALPVVVSGEHAGLAFVAPFERRTMVGPWGRGLQERRATAELRTGPRSTERVIVELAPWAHTAVELRVRPDARRPERWNRRRQSRYFDGAHEAIDALARELRRVTPAPAVHHPAIRIA